jgi:hypothetical protein
MMTPETTDGSKPPQIMRPTPRSTGPYDQPGYGNWRASTIAYYDAINKYNYLGSVAQETRGTRYGETHRRST